MRTISRSPTVTLLLACIALQGGKIKTWKLRYCCLHGGQLFYFVDADAAKPKGSIPLAGLQCVSNLPLF